MKSVKCGLVLCCLLFGICQADNGPPSPPQTVTILVPTTNTTTISTTQNPNDISTSPLNSNTTTTTTTQKPITTTTTTTTTTPKPNTTTTSTTTTNKPNTTTTSTTTTTNKPNTTTTTTTTTTHKPNTTTTTTTTTTPPPAPTPAPAPTPLPPATKGSWNFTENNITCIMVQFAGRLNVSYHMNNSGELAHALLNIPADATVTKGSCTPPQTLQMSWGASNESTARNSVLLQWSLNATTAQYRLSTLNVTLQRDQEHFPNSSETGPLSLHVPVSEWEVPVSTSYRCDSPLSVNLTEESGAVATLTVDHLHEEAYHNDTSAGFSAARSCAGPDLPDVVPIVVGCVLAGLVLVVLGAYLVARRRSTYGYLSM